MCKKLLSLFLVLQFLIGNFSPLGSISAAKMSTVEEVSTAEKENTISSSEKSRPKVSVIVPVYNTEPYLRECLDSIKNQTLKEIEIICVDDGSPDNCGKILDEYAANDSRFIVIHQENKGIAMARNTGLEYVTGEYLTFSDSDDVLQPNAYEVAYNAAHDPTVSGGVDILQFKFRTFFDGKDTSTISDKDYSKGTIMGRNEFVLSFTSGNKANYIWDKFFKSDILKKNKVIFLKGLSAWDDACFSYMFLGRAKNVKVISSVLYNYRVRKNSVSHKMSREEHFLSNYKMLKAVSDDWREHGYSMNNEHVLLHCLTTVFIWVGRQVYLKYAQKILDSFGADIYNAETVKKCDEQTQKLIRELEYAAQHPEKFQSDSREANNNIKKITTPNQKVNRLRRKVVA